MKRNIDNRIINRLLKDTIEFQQRENEKLQEQNTKYKKSIAANCKACEMNQTERMEFEQLKTQLRFMEGAVETEAFDARGLRHDVEQLRARVVKYRDLAQKFIDVYESGPDDETCKTPTLMDFHHKYYCMFKEYLSPDAADYHSPADVAEIEAQKRFINELTETGQRLLRKVQVHEAALARAKIALLRHLNPKDCDCIRDAFAAIDAIGGD
jgi:hypothetical protein